MALLRCQDCGKDYECTKKYIEKLSCDCGGSYELKGSDDDEWSISCEECSEDYTELGDVVEFENVGCICKKCIDKLYKVKEIVKENIIKKIVKVPKETIKVMGFSEPIL